MLDDVVQGFLDNSIQADADVMGRAHIFEIWFNDHLAAQPATVRQAHEGAGPGIRGGAEGGDVEVALVARLLIGAE